MTNSRLMPNRSPIISTIAVASSGVLLGSLLSFAAYAEPPRLSTVATEPSVTASNAAIMQGTQAQLDKRLSQLAYPYPVKFLQLKLPAAPSASASASATPVEGQSESPFESQFERVSPSTRPAEMAYMDVGPRDSDFAVLLLHGKNFSGAYWRSTIEALVKDGHRVIVPDQLGFGKSSKPVHSPWSFQQLALYNAELLDQLGVKKIAVVGHSMGGMLATRFSLMFPEKVSRLALVNPIGLEDWKLHVPYQSVDDTYRQELKKQPEQIKAYMQKSYFDGKWREGYNDLVTIQAGWVRGPDWPLMAWVSANHYDMIFNQPVLYEFPNLTMPVLLIIGGRDRTALGKGRVSDAVAKTLGRYDELGKKAAAAIPRARLVELPGVGHVPQYEAFDRYSSALTEFLVPEN